MSGEFLLCTLVSILSRPTDLRLLAPSLLLTANATVRVEEGVGHCEICAVIHAVTVVIQLRHERLQLRLCCHGRCDWNLGYWGGNLGCWGWNPRWGGNTGRRPKTALTGELGLP